MIETIGVLLGVALLFLIVLGTIAAIPVNVVAGKDCYAYANSGTHGSPTWTLCDNIQDVKISDSDDKTELKLRKNRPYKTNVTTTAGLNVTFKVPNIQGDAFLTALRTAKANKSAIDIAFLDGLMVPAAGVTSQGPRADWLVEKLEEDQATENADLIDVSVIPGQTGNVPAVFSVTGS